MFEVTRLKRSDEPRDYLGFARLTVSGDRSRDPFGRTASARSRERPTARSQLGFFAQIVRYAALVPVRAVDL